MEQQATTSQQRHGKVQWPGPIVQKTAEQGEDKRMRDTPINITEKKCSGTCGTISSGSYGDQLVILDCKQTKQRINEGGKCLMRVLRWMESKKEQLGYASVKFN